MAFVAKKLCKGNERKTNYKRKDKYKHSEVRLQRKMNTEERNDIQK